MLKLGYLVLTILSTSVLIYVYNYGLKKMEFDKATIKRRTIYLVLGILAWFVYVFAIAKSGFIATYQLPPRFPIFLILPAFVFTGVVLYRNRNSKMFEVIPQSWAIYYQSFRVVIESLFVATVAAGILHKEVTIEGYNFDMIFALTAPIIGYLVFKTKKLPKKVALYWNYLGLTVIASIIVLFITSIFFPSLWGSETALASIEMMSFPFNLVPAFLMPSAVFVHVFSIIQLRKNN